MGAMKSGLTILGMSAAVLLAAVFPCCAADPATTGAASVDVRYFAIIFGAESCPKRARFTHSWATMVKATRDPAQPESYQLAVQTISWMPRSLVIRPLALRGECGVNLSLEATFRDCFAKGECVVMWGPYEFDPARAEETYNRVCAQVARLNSGCVLYKCIDPDRGRRSTYISNCIHAVTDLDRYLPRPSYNEFRNYGLDASRFMVQVLASRHRFDVKVTHPWIADALGIDPRVQRRAF
jgi:hypothetical protein